MVFLRIRVLILVGAEGSSVSLWDRGGYWDVQRGGTASRRNTGSIWHNPSCQDLWQRAQNSQHGTFLSLPAVSSYWAPQIPAGWGAFHVWQPQSCVKGSILQEPRRLSISYTGCKSQIHPSWCKRSSHLFTDLSSASCHCAMVST